jgi:glucose/arabinose dehydrogenase
MRYFFLLIGLLLPTLLCAQFRIGTGEVADLYEMHCGICHGDALEGGLGGPLIGPLDYARNDAAMQMWIRAGNPALGMPAFAGTLTDPEIRSLVIYIREMRQKAERAEASGETKQGNEFTIGDAPFIVETVIEKGLETPWSIAFMPDSSILVTERDGRLRHFQNGKLHKAVSGTPEIWQKGQGGLMDVALHPEYAENGWIYLSFSEGAAGKGSTSIVRGRLKDNSWVDQERIFAVPKEHHYPTRHHFGTRLVFKDDYLFFAIGDRGKQDTAQDVSSPNGRVHRIYPDGRIPEDNPFRQDPQAFPSSWTMGNRNIQGMAMHPVTGEIWATEHGPRGGDELNLIHPGLNYGWPTITYGMNYNGTPITAQTEAPGLEQPALFWTPSIAVCGIDFYQGDRFPDWSGDLFVGGLASKELHRVRIQSGSVVEDEIILSGYGRIRDVVTGTDGAIYLVLNSPDKIVRLVQKP